MQSSSQGGNCVNFYNGILAFANRENFSLCTIIKVCNSICAIKEVSGHGATGPNIFALRTILSIFASNGVKQVNEMTILPSSQLEFIFFCFLLCHSSQLGNETEECSALILFLDGIVQPP